MTDAVGEEITLEEAPKTIVSMIPSNTEILFALGLNEEIVGVNDYDNYPEEALEKRKNRWHGVQCRKNFSYKTRYGFCS